MRKISLRRNFKYWFPVFLWLGFIFWMSTETFSAQNTSLIIGPILRFLIPSISQKKITIVHMVIRKFGHVTEYFISGLLLFRAFRNDSVSGRKWIWAFASLMAIVLIAACDEFHQSFVPTRTASLIDVGLDTFGGILAQCVSVLWYQNRRDKS